MWLSVDCNVALSLAIANLHVAIAQSKAMITHDPLPKLIANKTQLVQLFQNLIDNAIKFRQQQPLQIYIGAVRGGEEADNFSLSIPNSCTNATPVATTGRQPRGRVSRLEHNILIQDLRTEIPQPP